MKSKLQKLTDMGYKVQIRTRWTDNAWDVWAYRVDYKIQKDRPFFAWNSDLETAIDEVIETIQNYPLTNKPECA